MNSIISREEAERLVAPHVRRIGDFVYVSRDAAEKLLGPDRHGAVGGIYPWNVVDYLSNENPRVRAKP